MALHNVHCALCIVYHQSSYNTGIQLRCTSAAMEKANQNSSMIEEEEPVTWFTFYSHREKREYYYEPISGTTTWIAPNRSDGFISNLPGSPVERSSGMSFYRQTILPIITRPAIAIAMFLFNLLLLSVWLRPSTSQNLPVNPATLAYSSRTSPAFDDTKHTASNTLPTNLHSTDLIDILPEQEVHDEQHISDGIQSNVLSNELGAVDGLLTTMPLDDEVNIVEDETHAAVSDVAKSDPLPVVESESRITRNNSSTDEPPYHDIELNVASQQAATSNTITQYENDGETVTHNAESSSLAKLILEQSRVHEESVDEASDGTCANIADEIELTRKGRDILLDKVISEATFAGISIDVPEEAGLYHQVTIRSLDEVLTTGEPTNRWKGCNNPMARLLLPQCRLNT